ncbi:MAG: ABC transporter permease [Acidimicrobiales bacterium]
MWTAELRQLFRRTIVRAQLVVLFLIPVLLAVAVKLSGGPRVGQGPTFLDQVAGNGVFAALAGLTVCVPFMLPFTVAVVSGDTIAGEANLGTLRYLLVRPAGRVRLLGVKAVTVVAYSVAAALAVTAGGLAAGSALFPVGPVVGLSGTAIPLADGIGRTLLAGLIVGTSLLGLAAIGMFVSTLVNSPVGAMVITAGLVVAALIVENVPELAFAHPWVFSYDWLAFGDLLRSPVTWTGITRDLLLQAGYVAVFGAAAWARFTTRDVLA